MHKRKTPEGVNEVGRVLNKELYKILVRVYKGEKFRNLFGIYEKATDEEKKIAEQLEILFDSELIDEVIPKAPCEDVYYGITHFGKYVIEQTKKEAIKYWLPHIISLLALIVSIIALLKQ